MKLSERHLKAMTDWFDSIDESDQETYSKRVKKFTTFNDGDKRYRLFCYVTDLMDKNGLPLVLPDRKFNNFYGQKLYRGVGNINFNASTLADYDYHKGDGVGCLGIYATGDKSTATYYSRRRQLFDHNDEPYEQDVVSFKLNRDSKIIDFDSLVNLVEEFENFAEKKHLTLKELFSRRKFTKKDTKNETLDEFSENKQRLKYFLRAIHNTNEELYKAIIKSNSTIAILLGYDAVKMIEDGNIAILNRSKIVVSESEYKRITDASKNYKGGVINFEEKQENEFLRE